MPASASSAESAQYAAPARPLPPACRRTASTNGSSSAASYGSRENATVELGVRRACEQAAELALHVLHRLAGKRPPLGVDPALRGIAGVLLPALDQRRVDRRAADQRMRSPLGQRAVELLDRDENAAHPRDRVDAEVGARAVRRASSRDHLEGDEALVRDAELFLGRLRHDRAVRAPLAHERLGADAPDLLVDDGREDDVAAEPQLRPPASRSTIVAASEPFMSYEPRPYSLPSAKRASPGRSIASMPTVSVCAFRRSVRPPPLPRATATTFGRPGAASSTVDVEPGALEPARRRSARPPPRPARPGIRSGLTESIATSERASSATSLTAVRTQARRTRSRTRRPRPFAPAPLAAQRRRSAPRPSR